MVAQETGVCFLCNIQDVFERVRGRLSAPQVTRSLLGGVWKEEGGERLAKEVLAERTGDRVERKGCIVTGEGVGGRVRETGRGEGREER